MCADDQSKAIIFCAHFQQNCCIIIICKILCFNWFLGLAQKEQIFGWACKFSCMCGWILVAHSKSTKKIHDIGRATNKKWEMMERVFTNENGWKQRDAKNWPKWLWLVKSKWGKFFIYPNVIWFWTKWKFKNYNWIGLYLHSQSRFIWLKKNFHSNIVSWISEIYPSNSCRLAMEKIPLP